MEHEQQEPTHQQTYNAERIIGSGSFGIVYVAKVENIMVDASGAVLPSPKR